MTRCIALFALSCLVFGMNGCTKKYLAPVEEHPDRRVQEENPGAEETKERDDYVVDDPEPDPYGTEEEPETPKEDEPPAEKEGE